jgi:NTE family protein
VGSKVILVLEGGGAMCAYECGAYKAIVEYLQVSGSTLSVVAGASMGAVNAAIIARHYQDPDHGVGALEALWQELATPSVPFIPLPADYWQRWNALLTALLRGHPGVHTPNFVGWSVAGALGRMGLPLYDSDALLRTLSTHFGEYSNVPGEEPLLVVTAIDIERGLPVAFNSWDGVVTPERIVASGSIPILYPPRQIDGRFHWDGDFWSNTCLRDVLNLLQRIGDASHIADEYEVIAIDLYQQSGPVPQTDLQALHRMKDIVFGDKADYDEKVSRLVNRYIDLVREGALIAAQLPPSPLTALIERERQRIAKEKRLRLHFKRIDRTNLPDEHVSGIFDYSPKRLSALIAQGYENARARLSSTRTE